MSFAPAAVLRGIDRVLVKFTWIPARVPIRLLEVLPDKERREEDIWQHRLQEAAQLGVRTDGERLDTGESRQVHDVDPLWIGTELTRRELRLVEAHRFAKENKSGLRTTFVFVFAAVPGQDPDLDEAHKAFQELLGVEYGHGWFYRNPPNDRGEVINTINLLHPKI